MLEAVPTPIQAWDSYYVVIGSTAGALTGLQFVVLTLIAQIPAAASRKDSVAAFGSPNVVHFCAALLVAAILSAPWGNLARPAGALGICGALGVLYSVVVLRRALRQQGYRPVFEDWLWHTILPMLAYAALLAGGALLVPDAVNALFAIGGATLLLVFVGIHNAWDTVTYVTLELAPRSPAPEAGTAGASPARADTTRPPAVPPGDPRA